MLKRVVIDNYRSCLHTTLDLHPNLSVLIGPNGSGKTNILQAIMLLNKLTENERLAPPRTVTAPVSSRIKATFQHRATQSQLNAAIAASTVESGGDVMVSARQKWIIKSPHGKRAAFEAPLGIGRHVGSFLPRYYRVRTSRGVRMMRFTEEIPKWAGSELARIFEYCKGIRYYGASQFTNPGNCPASFQIEEEEGMRRRLGLSRFRGHEKVLYSMYLAQKAGGRYNQFIDIVGKQGLRLIDGLKFREVRTSSVDYSVRVGGKVERRKRNRILIIPQFRIGKQTLSPNQLSEGTFKTLALLFHVITDEGTALLIEEPEVCVHQGLLSSILELIKSFSDNKQMILSTHSDYVLDHVTPENVYQIALDEQLGTVARHVPKAMTSKEYSALRAYLSSEGNLGEYWREGGLGDQG
jgi:ABC-type lipoprotein export system ATPase subunit